MNDLNKSQISIVDSHNTIMMLVTHYGQLLREQERELTILRLKIQQYEATEKAKVPHVAP